MTSERPLPVADDVSAPYWAAAAEHLLVLAQCAQCHAYCAPPDVTCPKCGSVEPHFTFTPIVGHGTVKSWTVVRHSFLPGFADDLPFVLVDVELRDASGVRLIGRLLDGLCTELAVGTRVRAAFEDLAPGVAVPAFEVQR